MLCTQSFIQYDRTNNYFVVSVHRKI